MRLLEDGQNLSLCLLSSAALTESKGVVKYGSFRMICIHIDHCTRAQGTLDPKASAEPRND